jgi:hypothetical protein
MAGASRDFGSSRLGLVGGRPLVDSVFINDIKFIVSCWSWMKKNDQFPNI